jgi:hypothetical protein
MRTLMLFLLIFAGITSTYSQPFDKGQEIYLKSFKDKKPKDWTDDINGDTPIRRSISFQPVHVYLCNNVINFDFEELLSTVIISVICETTGETIYSNNYNNLDSFVIDLGTEKSGYYIIMIEYSNLLLVGNFTL